MPREFTAGRVSDHAGCEGPSVSPTDDEFWKGHVCRMPAQ